MKDLIAQFFRWAGSLFSGKRRTRIAPEVMEKMAGWKLRHPVILTVRDVDLSLWQSAVEEVVFKKLGGRPRRAEVLKHPMMQAVSEHVRKVTAGEPIDSKETPQTVDDHFDCLVQASALFMQRSVAKVRGKPDEAAKADQEIQRRAYEDGDPGFLTAVAIYEGYYALGLREPIYRDWQKEGKGDPEYGVIPWELPAGAKVGIIGDWGTGMDDALALLSDLVRREPDVIIHLGDIYYAGTDHQAQETFLRIFDEVFQALRPGKPRIPVFNMAGNHDYYARGTGFYLTLDQVNQALGADYVQPASFFCLRTADKSWQILGADTGVNDHTWTDAISPLFKGPGLVDSEAAWHRDKLSDSPKNAARTLLLSHHQFFSQDGVGSEFTPDAYINEKLRAIFSPYFATKIPAWIWGHEHAFGMFQNGLLGLQRGRLLGCSAYEQTEPGKVPPHAKDVPLQAFALQDIAGFANHAYAVIEFPAADSPDKDLAVSYYQIPSWGINQDSDPPPPLANPLITSETFPFHW